LAQFIVRPSLEHSLIDLDELWRYRHLLAVLVWRALKVRTQQTVVGIGWAVLQPLLLTAVFTVIFSRLAGIPADGQPYPVFVLSGLAVWQFVAQSFQQASASIVANSNLVNRVYFPRILLPLTAIGSSLFDLACILALLAVFMLWYGVAPSVGVLAFAPAIILAAATVLGLSLWLAALYVPYRDVGHLLPFITLVWMFVSPVIYPLSLLPPAYATLYAMNPIVVAIQTSRWAFAGGLPPAAAMVATSSAVAAALLASGLWFFRRREGTFADVV
jgi:homopolymeric O-antigen transport system permease protein